MIAVTDASTLLQTMMEDVTAKAERVLSRLTLSAVTFCIVVVTGLAGAGCLGAAVFFGLEAMYSLPAALAMTGLVCMLPVCVFYLFLSVGGRQLRSKVSSGKSAHAATHVPGPSHAETPAARHTFGAEVGDAVVTRQLVQYINEAVDKYPVRSIAAAALAGWAMSQTGVIDDLEI